MFGNSNETQQLKSEKEIPICGDGWLAVFDLLKPRQLGLQIALLSHRFDYYVDEHFKTRRWTLRPMRIYCKFRDNGKREMKIVNPYKKSLPIPKVPVPKKVAGFKGISIRYIDRNVFAFLRRLRHLFISHGTNLSILIKGDRTAEPILRNILSLTNGNISGMNMGPIDDFIFHRYIPSLLRDNCASLRSFCSYNDKTFPAFPANDSDAASNGQAVTKWLFTPLSNGHPKVLRYVVDPNIKRIWSSKINRIKTAFVNASSTANFIVFFLLASIWDVPVPLFELINRLTGERLTLKQLTNQRFLLLIRCPISRGERKWAKWEKEATEWRFGDQKRNRIDIDTQRFY